MAPSSYCFLVSMVVSLLVFLGSASTLTSTKNIDTVCHNTIVHNKTLCMQILTAYPPAVSASDMGTLSKITILLAKSYAEKTAGFVARLAKEPTFKTQFKACNESYANTVECLGRAIESFGSEVNDYDVQICTDETQNVKDLIGKSKDKASKRLMKMTVLMEEYILIAVGAIWAVKGIGY